MGKEKKTVDIMDEIKAMESKKREEAMKVVPVMPSEEKMAFDEWWVMRSDRIPHPHMKEVIKADFRGRGLKDKEELSAFDAALAKYGIELR